MIQASSVPVNRRAPREKTDALDVEMPLRTTLAARRAEGVLHGADAGRWLLRERQELIKQGLAITNL